MIVNVEWFNKRTYNVSNTQLEKKFEQLRSVVKEICNIQYGFMYAPTLKDLTTKWEMIQRLKRDMQKIIDSISFQSDIDKELLTKFINTSKMYYNVQLDLSLISSDDAVQLITPKVEILTVLDNKLKEIISIAKQKEED